MPEETPEERLDRAFAEKRERLQLRADRIEERLAALGLSQVQAARMAGQGQDYVRDLLRGKVRDPGALGIYRLSQALLCSVEYLIGVSDDVGSPSHYTPKVTVSGPSAAISLPVSHRLAEGLFRISNSGKEEFPGKHLNVLIDNLYFHAPHWIAFVEDDHASLLFPQGYFVLVVEAMAINPLGTPPPSRYVVVESYKDGGYLVERTIREYQTVDGIVAGLLPVGRQTASVVGMADLPWRSDGFAGKEFKIVGWIVNCFRPFIENYRGNLEIG